MVSTVTKQKNKENERFFKCLTIVEVVVNNPYLASKGLWKSPRWVTNSPTHHIYDWLWEGKLVCSFFYFFRREIILHHELSHVSNNFGWWCHLCWMKKWFKWWKWYLNDLYGNRKAMGKTSYYITCNMNFIITLIKSPNILFASAYLSFTFENWFPRPMECAVEISFFDYCIFNQKCQTTWIHFIFWAN